MIHVIKNALGNLAGPANAAAWGIAIAGAVWWQTRPVATTAKPVAFSEAEAAEWNAAKKASMTGANAPLDTPAPLPEASKQ